MENKETEQALQGYVNEVESRIPAAPREITPTPVDTFAEKRAQMEARYVQQEDRAPRETSEREQTINENLKRDFGGQTPLHQPKYRQDLGREGRFDREKSSMGYHKINVADLPSRGMFYPEGAEILIRAARGEDIKHWSTMDESTTEGVKSCWDYIIEKCVTPKFPGGGSWRDLAEVDQLYLLFATRELTFVNDDNNLFVKYSETKDIPVTKEMVRYIEFPDELMKYYSPQDRCFVLKLKNGKEINIFMPTFGVNAFLSGYIDRKINNGEAGSIDMDVLTYAPLLLGGTTGLTDKTYEEFVYQTNAQFGVTEWGVMKWVMDIFKGCVDPSLKWTNENGEEVSVPLSFRGGPSAIFSIPDPVSALC